MTLEDFLFNEEASSVEEFEFKMLMVNLDYPIEDVEMIPNPDTLT